MPIFDENRLKDEELFSGFTADDSDTFSINKQAKETPIKQEPAPEPEKTEQVKEKTKPEPKVIKPAIHKVEKKESNKRTHPILAGFSIAAIIIALLGGGYYWLTTVNSPVFFLEHSSSVFNSNVIIESAPEEIEEVQESEEIEIVEEAVPVDTVIPEPQTKKIIVKKKERQKGKPATTKAKPKPVVVEKPTIIKSKPAPVVVKKVPEQTKTISTKEVTASKPVPVTKTKPVPAKKELKVPSVSKTGLFTIQAYASESYDDAALWLKKLNRRNLNASIVPIRKRNKIIYTVRFGRFGTESEARIMAMKLGLSRSYIDRIK
jgi:septal ring-binding cell division protein DamX